MTEDPFIDPLSIAPFEPDGVYAGIPYRVLPNCSIEAMMPGGLVRFKTLDQLLAAAECIRSSSVHAGANAQSANLPAPRNSRDYYSLLTQAIKSTERNSAQLRALVYERARFNLKRDLLFGHSSLGVTDLVRQISDFELAIARIEANAIEGPGKASAPKETHPAVDPDEIEIADDDQRHFDSQEEPIERQEEPTQLDTFTPTSHNTVQVLAPQQFTRRYDADQFHQSEHFPYDRRVNEFLPYKRYANLLVAILLLGVALIGTLIFTSMLWLSPRVPHQVIAAKPPPEKITPNIEPGVVRPAPAPKDIPPKVAFPLPTSFGIYALNDDKLTELHSLKISVPDPRVSLSAEITNPSATEISGNKPAFILFQRSFRDNAPQKVTLRIIARTARETKIVDGKANVTKIEGSWRIRNISYDLKVSPIAGKPEMLIARLDKSVSLTPGRYALVLNRAGYDFTIAGPVKSPQFCLEGFETRNGTVYNQCRGE